MTKMKASPPLKWRWTVALFANPSKITSQFLKHFSFSLYLWSDGKEKGS